MTSRLSVNPGLRYTLNYPSTETKNQGAIFNQQTQKLEYLGQDGFPETARELHKLNFGPITSAGDPRVIQFGFKINF